MRRIATALAFLVLDFAQAKEPTRSHREDPSKEAIAIVSQSRIATGIRAKRIDILPAGARNLSYTFTKSGSLFTTVLIADFPSGPKVTVIDIPKDDLNRRERSFTLPRAAFDKMWATFKTSGADRFVSRNGARVDVAGYYCFLAENHSFDIPINKASPALLALATELRAFAYRP